MCPGHLIHKEDRNKCDGDNDEDTNSEVAERYDNDVGMRKRKMRRRKNEMINYSNVLLQTVKLTSCEGEKNNGRKERCFIQVDLSGY